MSVQPGTIDDEGYCEVQDVLNYFDRFDIDEIDENPQMVDRIQRSISAKSNAIDKETGHAWRPRKVKGEYKNLENVYRWNSGMPVYLSHRDIRTPFDASKGDSIQLWEGNEYTDLVADDGYSEGRDEDYWIEESTGVLYLYRRSILFSRYRELKVDYRYGKERVPADIQEICAKLVAADLMETDFYRYTTPGNEDAPNAEKVADGWRESAQQQLRYHTEIRGTGL